MAVLATMLIVREATSSCRMCLNLITIKYVIILIIDMLYFVSYFLVVKISHYALVFIFFERDSMFILQPK